MLIKQTNVLSLKKVAENNKQNRNFSNVPVRFFIFYFQGISSCVFYGISTHVFQIKIICTKYTSVFSQLKIFRSTLGTHKLKTSFRENKYGTVATNIQLFY